MTPDAARAALEDAVYRALEAGLSPDDIKGEVEYALESADG